MKARYQCVTCGRLEEHPPYECTTCKALGNWCGGWKLPEPEAYGKQVASNGKLLTHKQGNLFGDES